MLQKLKIPIIILVTAILTQLAGYAVHAAMPDALLPDGSTRYAAAVSTSVENVLLSDGWIDLPGMTKFITIPTGKTADVIVIFCGSSFTGDPAYLSVRALIRDVLASPEAFQLQVSDTVGRSSHCAIFLKTNVASGSPAVKIQWQVTGGKGATVVSRSMLVIVNIH